jgi:hypothetical protein
MPPVDKEVDKGKPLFFVHCESKHRQKLLPPIESNRRSKKIGKTYVWTVRKGIVQRVGIVRGQETETGIEIKQGLNDGDVVVVSPQANLANGRKVSVETGSNRRMK